MRKVPTSDYKLYIPSKNHVPLPDKMKEYLAIYTTEYDDSYILEPIVASDLEVYRSSIVNQKERIVEASIDYDVSDPNAGFTAEAHHIDYYVNSLNNDSNNQMIVCPNHHSIIHDANPRFDRKRMMYLYPNGVEQRIVVNLHLR